MADPWECDYECYQKCDNDKPLGDDGTQEDPNADECDDPFEDDVTNGDTMDNTDGTTDVVDPLTTTGPAFSDNPDDKPGDPPDDGPTNGPVETMPKPEDIPIDEEDDDEVDCAQCNDPTYTFYNKDECHGCDTGAVSYTHLTLPTTSRV